LAPRSARPGHAFRRWPALAASLVLLWPFLPGAAFGAAAEALSVRLVCPPRPAPGRVVCEVELEVEAGTLAWADVLVIEAPPFAPPLRSRVGPTALFMKTEQRQRLQLALAATRAGSGELRVRARVVWCADAERRACRPMVRQAEATVRVGPITE
jgi:uncharacterized protein (DUF58 family)